MKIFILLFTDLIIIISSSIDNYIKINNIFSNVLKDDINDSYKEDVIVSIKNFLKNNFKNYKYEENDFNICVNQLFNKTDNFYNYLYLFSNSGKKFSDLGLQSDCIEQGFSYYLLSFNYNITSEEEDRIYNFLEQNKFFLGLCLFKECDALMKSLIQKNSTFLDNFNEGTIIKIEDEENKPYYTLNEFGYEDEELNNKEKKKHKIFFILFIIIISFLGIELIIGIINFGYEIYIENINKMSAKKLYAKESDEDDGDTQKEESPIFFNNSDDKKEKEKTLFKVIIKFIVKYFNLFSNIKILMHKKSKYYNNKNMRTIIKLRIFSLLLITFSANFDILINISSKVFYDDYFYKKIYFGFFKFASFGLDIYICLDGFEVMYKLMNFYKINFYNKDNKSITFIGILKFYLYSLSKIFLFLILSLLLNYFNRYYIYIHNGQNGSPIYFYYSNNILDKTNILEIFNPKYTFLSYFSKGNKIDEEFIFKNKIYLIFINEFYIYTLFIIIFYIGNNLKSKIYDYFILIITLFSYLLTYFICSHSHYDENNFYTYRKISRSTFLAKYPHVIFNHYIIGAFTGLTCFYLKESNLNISMTNERDKCPFIFCLNIKTYFEFLNPLWRKIFLFVGIIMEIIICETFTLLIFFGGEINDDNLNFNYILSHKLVYYYESGLFILVFCFNTILFYTYENENKDIGKYNIINLIDKISFSYANNVYIMIYSYYCLFNFQFKLTYHNLWFITFGLFIFFCFENLLLTIAFGFPFKIIVKTLADKYIILNKTSLHLEEIRYTNNNIINNQGINNNDEDEEESDSG